LTPAQLRSQLSTQFQILCFTDLSTILISPSQGFKIFHDQYKEVFENNERIVFYVNGHVGPKTLAFLHHASDVFDISRCFVMVCCPSHDHVEQHNDLEFMTVDIESPIFKDDSVISVNTLCVMPHFNLEYANNGQIKACCFIKDVLRDQNDTTPVQQIFHADKISNLRHRLMQGQRPPECNICWEQENKGLQSLRQWRNKYHKKEFLTDLLDKPKIKSVSVRASTICNFKCRICTYESSSSWAEEELAHETDPLKKAKVLQSIKQNKWFDNDTHNPDEVINLCEDLDFIDVYGGEPLLLKQFKRMLEASINTGSCARQRLHFNTNASLFPTDLILLMHKFKEVDICCSIDDIGTRFETERGGSWAGIEQNIDNFLSLDRKIFKVSCLVTVSNLNLLYLDELLQWANRKQLPLVFNILNQPKYLRYDRVSDQVRTLAIKKYQDHDNETLRSLSRDLEQTTAVDTTEWLRQMHKLDLRRGQNIMISHPELAQGMGYSSSLTVDFS
jgi:MoaA/NifB/PqqE/SkfB family radical SAM enzyme